MATEKVETLVVGGGQAGLAMSEHLSNAGISHLVLERARIAERWRSERWDSLVANGPAWHDRFPSLEFVNSDPEEFVSKEQVADYFVDYSKVIKAPVRCGVEVTSVERIPGQNAFRVETSQGVIEATSVVAATGPFQKPVIPPVISKAAPVKQIHSNAYRNPDQLAQGAVLVVGAGSSGVQIADELQKAGRKVFLSVGPHDRPPRMYRGRDFVWWLGVLGLWDVAAMEPGKEHVTIAVSGADGGHTIDFRKLAHQGMTLVGMTAGYNEGVVSFEGDLEANLKAGDENLWSVFDAADAYVARTGIELPQEPEARLRTADPDCVINPLHELDLVKEGITTILWATGYAQDYSWIKADICDAGGKPKHQRGVSTEPGIYFLGLPWQSRRGSSFIWGVWHDAKYVADQIGIQRSYQQYQSQRYEQETPICEEA